MTVDRDIRKREEFSNFYIYFITLVGIVVLAVSMPQFRIPPDPSIYLLLVVFIGIAEYSPVPVWKGSSALSFPLLYAMDLTVGTPVTLVTYASLMAMVNAVKRRPLRLVLFTPAQLVISLALAKLCTLQFASFYAASEVSSELAGAISQLLIFTISYYSLNNLMVDLLLIIRPQPYSWRHWRLKSIPEAMVAALSFLYGSIMLILGSQNRGQIDAFSYLFFFSPLVAMSLISSSYMRMKKEKMRLHSLFQITTELNRVLPTGRMDHLKGRIREFLETQAFAIWYKSDGKWALLLEDGTVQTKPASSKELTDQFETITKIRVISNRDSDHVRQEPFFDDAVRAIVYSPLIVEDELVGMFAAGRTRSNSFTPEDVQSLATLSNQLASLLKTRILISEREQRLVLEERNRIAREIHDGIAQSLAGAVFKLESAQRKNYHQVGDLKLVLEDILRKLRVSLREVRQSIYALRPYPTERLGIRQALEQKIGSIRQDYGLAIHLQERGRPYELSPMVEKVIFDTVQEGLQNAVNHAKATKVEILLSYQEQQVLVKIKDDGVGFQLLDALIKAKREAHYGILHMNEQAEKLGAALQIDSTPGKGSEIILQIPNLEAGGAEHDTRNVGG
ncbi:GAF domain-containing sensor histidine kinase [Effusibacillus lacus]|uniref:histidine kinase n=1 Tax=Effusibacillus lacus TaxID=1348429 RepID=A0A292YP72_9BACL|nr:GAF domain-containing sensor histidine kinase [Effusibacillus lacus]TCS68154.1 hypothetical protein EDD64_1456 [Effusibacillus lacus]GAX90285.1 histidine kinase [Effusibacillus lacus]